jgi:hypothetical protein
MAPAEAPDRSESVDVGQLDHGGRIDHPAGDPALHHDVAFEWRPGRRRGGIGWFGDDSVHEASIGRIGIDGRDLLYPSALNSTIPAEKLRR